MARRTCIFPVVLATLLLPAPSQSAPREFASLAPELAGARVLGFGAPLGTEEELHVRASLAALRQELHRGQDAQIIAAVEAFYGQRRYQTLWMRRNRLRARAFSIAGRLAEADADGLDPEAYRLPRMTGLPIPAAQRRAEIDVALSFAAVRFATHLSSGRIKPSAISRSITQLPEAPSAGAILTTLLTVSDPRAALDRLQPPHRQYSALKAKLAELRLQADESPPRSIPAGKLLKPGRSDPRVPILRARLATLAPVDPTDRVGLDEGGEPAELVYDASLVAAVRSYQAAHKLKADGIVGPATISALNSDTRQDRIVAIVTNMERWRWMPRDLGSFHIAVNVPEFKVRVNDSGFTVHSTRVVVGKPENQTPIFSDEMEHVVVNPYWNVPTSILTKEMLPAIRRNPSGYFRRNGYQVVSRSRGRVLHPGSVNWYALNPRSIRVRQRPGSRNALGRIKFMFPNKHAVYLHDTPAKSLFDREFRAFSHGCVRVHNPFEFADAILRHDGRWTAEQIRELVGGRERRVNLSRTIPVHLSYFTLNIEDDGTLRRFTDLYGHDRKLRAALGL